MPMLSSHSVPQSQPKTLIHPHEQCSAANEQWSRVMEFVTLHWKASNQLKSLASKPAADPNLLRLLNSAVINKPHSEKDGDQSVQSNGVKDILNSKTVSSDGVYRTSIPWMSEDKVYLPGIEGLHQEMEDFYNYMEPIQEERYMRNEIVNRLRQVATSLWANAEVKVYGSFETGLYLPTSDIDVVIKCPDLEPLAALTLLEQSLIKQGDCDDVKVIRTSVPIVKFTDKSTATKVDVSINIDGALTSAEFIKEMMVSYPELKYLGFVLKQLLTSKGLLESFNGGISSYCLVLLIVSYLQLHPEDRLTNNYGLQLIKFLELYGRHFNYLNCGIRVTDGGSYFRKGENSMGDKFSLLCVEDPFNTDNDVGQSCFGAMKVREEFDRAFRELCDGVLPQYSHLQPPSTSLLARVLHIAPEVVAYRRFVFERYRHLFHNTQGLTGTYFLPQQGEMRSFALQQQPINHYLPPNPYPQMAYESQQQLNYGQQKLSTMAPPSLPLHMFQQYQLQACQHILSAENLQQPLFKYSHYALPNYLLSNIVTQPLPLDGIYQNQMMSLRVQPSYTEDRSDSDSLSSQHSSSQSSQVSQGNHFVGSSKTSNESEQEQESNMSTANKNSSSSTPLPPVEITTISSATLLTTMTSSVTSSHLSDQQSPTTAIEVAVTASNCSYNGNKSPKNDDNSLESSSSNKLDTLCEITNNSKHLTQGIKTNNSHHHHHPHHHHDRYHQSNKLSGLNNEDNSNRSHYIQKTNSMRHNNNGSSKGFPSTVFFSRSSPPLDSSSRSSHQSRQGINRSGTNHHRNQTNISSATSPVTSSQPSEPSSISRSKTSSVTSSQSTASSVATTTTTTSSVVMSSSSVTTLHQQQHQRNGSYYSGASHKTSRKYNNAYPQSSNNFSRNSFKNQKISSSSSSSSSCSPTYSPATFVSADSR